MASEKPVLSRHARSLRPALAVRLAIALTIFVMLDAILCLALMPYGSNAQMVWYEYRQLASEPLTTLVVGTSLSQNGIARQPLEEAFGPAVNLSTPCQSLDSSLQSIKRALDDHPEIERVLLGTSYSELENAERLPYQETLALAMATGATSAQQLATVTHLVTSKTARSAASVAMLFPFAYSHVDYKPAAIMANVRRRIESSDPVDARARLDGSWIDQGHGFANYTGQVDLSNAPTSDIVELFRTSDGLCEDELSSLAEICTLCEERGISLEVFIPPEPLCQVVSLEARYPEMMTLVRSLTEDHGATFLDFNLINPDVYRPSETEFGDAIHLNADGASRFTKVLANMVQDTERGADAMGSFFSYEQWNAFLSTVNGVQFAFFEDSLVDGHVELQATAYTGPSCQVEYEWALYDEPSDAWTVFQDWSSDASAVLPLSGYGTARVRMAVRQAGTDVAERTRIQTVTYQCP